MNYLPEFTAKARSAWRALPLASQERVLDAMDELAQRPLRKRLNRPTPLHVYDIVFEAGTARHYLFLQYSWDHVRKRVIVESIGHFERKR